MNNFLPFKTLLIKEIKRFLAVFNQTLLAPLVTSSLYLLVFGAALGSRISIYENFTYIQFVIPGLVLMGVISNSFANVSSSLFLSKYIGNIVDLLVTPLGPLQYIMGYSIAAMIRGLLVGALTFVVGTFFTSFDIHSIGWVIVIAILSSFLFAQFGMLAAIFSSSFDTLSMFTNFLILPLIYLGGLFYPVEQLPSPWNHVSMINPLTYLISSFRYSFLGVGEMQYSTALPVILFFCVSLFACNWLILKSGYKLRA